MTRRAWRRFRFALFALMWLGAAAFQSYVSDVGVHGVAVGGYLPDWLLAVAQIPPWAFLIVVAVDVVVALIALRAAGALLRILAFVNSALLMLYGAIGIAVLYYIAFARNGIS